MRRLAVLMLAAVLVPAARAAYESSFGIKPVPGRLHLGKPVNFKYAYEFSHGLSSFGGAWTAHAGGGKGDGAALEDAEGAAGDPGLRFSFDLRPGGDLWALLLFRPGRFSALDLGPDDGFFFRARTSGPEMDGYPARWFLQVRVRDRAGRYVSYRTEDFEVLPVWQTFYVSAHDLGREGQAGLFADGSASARLFDASFLPNTEKYRSGDLVLDAFMVYGPGRKVPGADTDGDGVPDPVDGDGDNDGVLDFAQGKGDRLVFTRTGYVQGGGSWEGRFVLADRTLAAGETLSLDASLRVESEDLARALPAIPEVVGLLVGECRYDREGRWHSFTNYQMSSLLTPSGLPIENYQELVPTRHALPGSGVPYTSPVDGVCRVPLAQVRREAGGFRVDFSFRIPIGKDVPEGHWWLYFEFGALDQNGTFTRFDSLPYDARR
ncbi:MAG: thrombospondin type 3 repeat-containing protein, partial [Planctomycetes bacterium]|nr:thrombospondin type 3 repeat-containing protein [Planctomycetota bacterium]